MQTTEYYRDTIPDWAYDAMLKKCTYCRAPIIMNEALTSRQCANPKCPGHMAYKLVELAKYFNVKGIGPATARTLITDHRFETHFDIMKFWYPTNKPLASLATIADLACIEGYGKTQAEVDLARYESFEDYFTHASYVHPLLLKSRKLLYAGENYFTVLPPLADNFIRVMGTGSFHGYTSRESYFEMVNLLFGDKLHVIQCGKRKTGVSFLIKEPDAVDHSKSALAESCNIPVVTPLEFIQILCTYCHITIEDIKQKGEQLRCGYMPS